MNLFPEETPYRVLARKYRPGDFDTLIGQKAMVETLANAIRHNRLAQAWLLTGVRGVGKTSTARIIAKSLNCIGADGTGGPTIHPCGVCQNCVSIAAGQNLDVIEIDAASNTGVDNIREIIEAVRYAPVAARYKIYIIDEVHMLSKGAFNALLKTLEEPPPHVKFIFATTEVQKVPATILSRCQRFDLKRVAVEQLEEHFRRICAAEGSSISAEALALVARAAEGSVRDGLSILDQALALAGGAEIDAATVRAMLGLASRGQLLLLMDAILGGDLAATLAEIDRARAEGVEPIRLLEGLLDLVHATVRAKLATVDDPGRSAEDAAAIRGWAQRLSFPALHRLWQMLLKGHGEVGQAPVPQQAAEMAILRLLHAADLPDPGRIALLFDKLAQEGGAAALAGPVTAAAAPVADAPAVDAPAPTESPARAIASAADVVALFNGREPQIARWLTDEVAIAIEGEHALYLGELRPAPPGFVHEVQARLEEWTGAPWNIAAGPPRADGESLLQKAHRAADERRDLALENPTVQSLLQTFPGAELLSPAPFRAPFQRNARS